MITEKIIFCGMGKSKSTVGSFDPPRLRLDDQFVELSIVTRSARRLHGVEVGFGEQKIPHFRHSRIRPLICAWGPKGSNARLWIALGLEGVPSIGETQKSPRFQGKLLKVMSFMRMKKTIGGILPCNYLCTYKVEGKPVCRRCGHCQLGPQRNPRGL